MRDQTTSTIQYFADLQWYPLLDAATEADALARLVRGRQAARLLRAGHDTPRIRRAVFTGANARDQLVTGNLRLVAVIATAYVGRGLDELDLIQEGTIGLIRAVRKYNPAARRHGTFANFAGWWIKEAICSALAAQARLIRIPRGMYWSIHRMRRVAATLEAATGATPSPAQLAAALGCTIQRVTALLATVEPISLATPVGDTSEATVSDFIPSSIPPIEQIVHDRQLYAQLAVVINALSNREREVIARRFGLLDGRPQRLEAIGTIFGHTREAIRKTEAKALARMAQGMAAYAS